MSSGFFNINEEIIGGPSKSNLTNAKWIDDDSFNDFVKELGVSSTKSKVDTKTSRKFEKSRDDLSTDRTETSNTHNSTVFPIKGDESIFIPSTRSDIRDLFIMLRSVVGKIDIIEKKVKDIEKTILLMENSNIISDSDMKEFIQISLERLEKISKFSEFKESLEDNELLILSRDSPSKDILEIDRNLLENIIDSKKTYYITDNTFDISKKLEQIRLIRMVGKDEEKPSKQVKLNII
jgi:hypothetical protein